jgi:type I restriction enzyme S subunit
MEDWKMIKLGALCTSVASGGTPSRKKPEYYTDQSDGIHWVKSKELLENGIFETEEKISPLGLKNSSARKYPPGTVLVALIGANIGQLGWLGVEATLNQNVLGLQVDPEKADWRYVFFALTARKRALQGLSRGGAQSNLNKEMIEDFEIPVPSTLVEQTEIADSISAFDNLIENNVKRISVLEETIEQIFNEWFLRFRYPSEKNIELRDSLTEYGDIPINWEISTIGKAFSIVLGGTPSRTKKEFWVNGSIPWINSGEVNKSRITQATELITPLALEKSATKMLMKRSTILAITGATLGQVSLTEMECCANQSVIAIYDEADHLNEYIFLRISRDIKKIIALAGGGAQQHINKEVIEQRKILIPEPQVTSEFKRIVSPMFDLIANLLKSNHALVETRELLIRQLISSRRKAS